MFCVSEWFGFVLWWDAFDEPRQIQGRGLVDPNKLKPPSNRIAGRPKAALLFWFCGDFRCGALLFMVILDIYEYKNR